MVTTLPDAERHTMEENHRILISRTGTGSLVLNPDAYTQGFLAV